MTYAQIDAGAAQVAAGLASLGLAPGEKVALSCPNVPWFPLAYFGILKAGGVVVPLNVLLKPREIAYHLKDSDAKAFLAFEGTPELPIAQMARAACDDSGCPNLVIMTIDPAAPAPVAPAITLAQLMDGKSAAFATRRCGPSAGCADAQRPARQRGQCTTISVNGQTYACIVTYRPTRHASAIEWKNT